MSPKLSTLIQEEKKELIIEAAYRCFAAKGFIGTSIDDIAAEAGGSKGAIYNYYNSKDEIFLTLMERINRKAYLDLIYRFGYIDTPEMKLRYLINTDFPLNILGPNWRRVRLEFLLSAADRESFQVFWRQEEARFVDIIENIYTQGQNTGLFFPYHAARSLAELFWISQNTFGEDFFCENEPAHDAYKRERERIFIDNLLIHD